MSFRQSNMRIVILAEVVLAIGFYCLIELIEVRALRLKHLIFISSIAIMFFSGLLGREKYTIYFLFAVLSFYANPFRVEIFFGLSCYLILALSLGMFAKNNPFGNSSQNDDGISLIKKWLLFFLFLSIVLPFLSDSYNPFVHPGMMASYANFVCFVIIVILFIDIIPKDIEMIEKLMFIFNLSVFVHLLSYLSMRLSLPLIPSFLTTGSSESTDQYRFMGLMRDYELIVDYLITVIGFSMWMIYYNKHRIFSFAFMGTAFILGFLSGTRSFFVTCILLLMVNTSLVLLKSGSRKKIIISLIFVIIVAVVFVYAEGMEIFRPVFDRAQDSIYAIQHGQIELAANRQWSEAIPVVIEKAGLLGHGAFLCGHFYDHVMVPHCLYLDMYSKFGLLGIVALVFLFFKMSKMSYKIGSGEFILFSTVITLAVHQSKISALRNIESMLIYTFLFTAIYVLHKKPRDRMYFKNTKQDKRQWPVLRLQS